MAVAAPARKAVPRTAPARKAARPAPARKATARTAPARKRTASRVAPVPKTPARRRGGQLVPIAVGTATAVRNLPDSGLIVRLTRGRAWIGVLGLLLAGIVALNVITLSLAATASQVDQNIQALDRENSILRSRDAQKSGATRVRHDAASLGLSAASVEDVGYLTADPADVASAAQRLAAAGDGY
ncbi:MAG TPA: hypothetical protein VFU04_05380 [Solirubrobacterales bacterium]|nr:hypothetical protein [Solirubrobacterales bacterium]